MAADLWAVDPASDRPIYKQIADALRQRLDGGEYGAGDKLPSESELMQQFGASRATVRKAFDVLMSEGRVESRRGVGVFVRIPPSALFVLRDVNRLKRKTWGTDELSSRLRPFEADAEKSGGPFRQEIRQLAEVSAPPDVARHLDIDEGDTVFVRRRRILLDGRPAHLGDSYLPLDIAMGALRERDTGPGGTYARMEDAGHRLSHFDEQLTFRMPTSTERRALRLGHGVPVVDLVRIAHTRTRPLECFVAVMAGDRYRFAYEIPAD
jgi:GntR family transcriptional regulator